MRSSPSDLPQEFGDALAAVSGRLGRLASRCVYYLSTTSTNDEAAALADAPDAEGVVVVAEGVVERGARQGQADLADAPPVHDQASTPTPIGQVTPVPPMPQ